MRATKQEKHLGRECWEWNMPGKDVTTPIDFVTYMSWNSSFWQALVKAQSVWSKYYVPGFKFFIGISGKFFKRGLPEEQEGDERIISRGK